jgi:hypothetical protein
MRSENFSSRNSSRVRLEAGGPTGAFYSTGGHTDLPTLSFQYTFEERELEHLLAQDTASAIVHHGAIPATSNYLVVHSHLEGLPLFVSNSIQIESVTSSELGSLFSGAIANWKHLGGGDLSVDIGIRADGVFWRASQNILRQNSLWITRDVFAANSYEELASFRSQRAGAMLIGLRGPSVGSANLKMLKIDGREMFGASSEFCPLSCRLSLLLRKHDLLAVELGERFAANLRERWCEDGMEIRARTALEDLDNGLRRLRAESRNRLFRVGTGAAKLAS